MADKYHIISEFYDFTTGAQMMQYTDHSEVNQHANAELGWEEHLERVQVPEENADLELRWWEYNAAPKDGKKNPLIVSFFEYYNSCWQQIADREGLTIVAFEYHKNSRIPAGGRGTLGYGPMPDEIATYHKVIGSVIDKYDCDRTRIYMSGLSYGDMTAQIYSSKYGKDLAGLVLMNGPSSYYNLNAFGMRDQTELPCMQMRSDDDYTCDGFPWPDYDDAEGAKAFVKDIRSLQTVMNRDVWMKTNGAEDYSAEITTDRHYSFAVYQGKNCEVIYCEIFGHCHIVPIDAAEIMWSALFSRYRRGADGRIERIAPAFLKPDKNVAIAVGIDKAYVDNKAVGLPAASILISPPEKLTRDSYTYHRSEDRYETVYAPVEILKEGFGIDYKVEENPATLQTHIFAKTISPDIEVKDASVYFSFRGSDYRLMTDCNMVIKDGRVTDLERPPFYVRGQLYVPVMELAKLLGYCSSRNEDTVYITDHEVKLGYTVGRLIREEMLSERDEDPKCSITLLPCENGSAKLSEEIVSRGRSAEVYTKPAPGYVTESVEVFINGYHMPVYKTGVDTYYICNIMKDIELKVNFVKKEA